MRASVGSEWTGGRGPRAAEELPTAAFDYALPPGLIAHFPAARRDESRLLVVDRAGGRLVDRCFHQVADYFVPGDALVLNDTRVFPARLRGRKPSGAPCEVLLLHPVPDAGREGRRWEAIVRPGGKLKPGRRVIVAEGFAVAIEDSTPNGERIVRLEGEADAWTLIERYGQVPLPPYIDREPEPLDRERYQTVYAAHTGSVAAPTAGLHFTPELLRALERRGVSIVRITLHIGLGTFRPVDAECPAEHVLPAERFRVSADAADRLARARENGGSVWAVGTTVVRVLETLTDASGRTGAGSGWTELFIYPPYVFRGVDHLITNFHLPRSSLLMLVSAFAGYDLVMRAYEHAIREHYRFYSYGDSMVVL